ncbi:MAG: aminopeptidase P family protein [Clostridia bacterium]|nr:aminopeptidase P family protein [Clostridia bacterium]
MTHLAKFQEKLAPLAGAALVTTTQNQFYLTDFHYDDGYVLILPDAAYVLADFRYIEVAKNSVGADFTVIQPESGMNGAVKELLCKHGVDTLLLEEDAVTLQEHSRLSAVLEGVKLVAGASALFAELRLFKDEKELAAMAAAQELTDAAFTHILDFIRPGIREIDVALELEFFMRKSGAEGLAFETIAVSGTASSLPHGVPRDLPLEKGFLTMDFGARYGGYCSDMTRTVVLGHADDEMKHLYNTVLTAQKAALAVAHGGMSCKALDKVARDIIENAGYKGRFGHSLGHGIGIDVHECPRVAPRVDEKELLLPGHVVSCEPGIYIEGKYGCRIEDMIAVLPDGSIRNFTKSPKELIEIV